MESAYFNSLSEIDYLIKRTTIRIDELNADAEHLKAFGRKRAGDLFLVVKSIKTNKDLLEWLFFHRHRRNYR